MASFLSVLKSIGKDMSHVGQWIDDGLKIAEPIIGLIDPPLAPIILAVETALGALPVSTTVTADTVQKFVTASATTQGVKSICCPAMTCPTCGGSC